MRLPGSSPGLRTNFTHMNEEEREYEEYQQYVYRQELEQNALYEQYLQEQAYKEYLKKERLKEIAELCQILTLYQHGLQAAQGRSATHREC